MAPPTTDAIRKLLPRVTSSTTETMDLGARIATTLDSGAVLALCGVLGTGKTHFVKGVARGLGVPPASVRSPTFTILSVYDEGERPLYHFDAYRVQRPDEFVELGFEEYVHDGGVACIEWADRVTSLLPPNTIHLQFQHVAPAKRRLTLGAPNDASDSENV